MMNIIISCLLSFYHLYSSFTGMPVCVCCILGQRSSFVRFFVYFFFIQLYFTIAIAYAAPECILYNLYNSFDRSLEPSYFVLIIFFLVFERKTNSFFLSLSMTLYDSLYDNLYRLNILENIKRLTLPILFSIFFLNAREKNRVYISMN